MSEKDLKLRVWKHPKNNPSKVSYKAVTSLSQAHKYLEQIKHNDALCGGLEVYKKDGKSYKWITWVNSQGDDIDQVDKKGNSLTTQAP